MVHQYKNNGYNIVLDVCSGSVHVVDDLVYDIISLYEEKDKEQMIKALSQYDSADVAEAYDEVAQLVEDGTLFTDDVYKDYIIDFKKRTTRLPTAKKSWESSTIKPSSKTGFTIIPLSKTGGKHILQTEL